MLRDVLPRTSIVVTDSGRHQYLVRRHYPVLTPRGLIIPADFQSMGFGLPAALGAALAEPDRQVVAVVGDGGLAMTGFELGTAVREGVRLAVIVWNDGGYGLIRTQQLREYGSSHGVDHEIPDLEALAAGLGADFHRFDGGRDGLRQAIGGTRPVLIEVRAAESAAQHVTAAIARWRQRARRVPLLLRLVRWVRRVVAS
jgi:acetolactate synthase I/II/III large subunit